MQAFPLLQPTLEVDAPIGVYDSGVGGLSVLRHIRSSVPNEDLLYFADSGFAPIGGKLESEIVARCLTIAEFFMTRGIKSLVLACNTATAAAAKILRKTYPNLPLVGVEPGLKPAATVTKTGTIGVLATKFTVNSAPFAHLRAQIETEKQVRFLPQACVGLADQVEKGALETEETAAMIQRYVTPLIAGGADTLVLGCTHYPFVQKLIEMCAHESANHPITLIDTGEAVARQLVRLLNQHHLQREAGHIGTLAGFTSGSEAALTHAFSTLLTLRPDITEISFAGL